MRHHKLYISVLANKIWLKILNSVLESVLYILDTNINFSFNSKYKPS